ncbi:hypothetical protein DC081_08210 [Ignatzschineria cameli]|uniref:Uncharacterized protein n=1 Tax=Ignatzschineria cameli TaxID=2182793 RepID=A0ABX5L1U7_9GAMM|nr:hypothetical protein DC080_07640 [Ignatzschineria cameli]PWD88556.1 hypothetical protein DC079_09050 [Ignatzschineria cameli]PWD89992.1 hypothetical protein DC081_08210 [Ignatzschineria cameli]PWD90052.1 hypothetical protein DC078_09080 [Ignatzschineria cameli]
MSCESLKIGWNINKIINNIINEINNISERYFRDVEEMLGRYQRGIREISDLGQEIFKLNLMI